jgi:hypothetical protein
MFRAILISAVLVLLISSLTVPTYLPSTGHAILQSSPPVLGGWGGTKLADTAQNTTAPASLVFPGENQSNFEQVAMRQFQLGYNTIRVSFAPYCSVQYGLNTFSSPQNFMSDYNSGQLDRAIKIAQRFNLWLVVDYHGYADFTNSTLVDCWLKFWFGPDSSESGPTGVVGAFMNSYTRIVWEPLNEPASSTFPATLCQNPAAYPSRCDDNRTAYMSTQYQSWLNIDRKLGDTSWVVVQNLCSYGCYKDRNQYYLDYPIVNDTASHVFESFHTYLGYGMATTASDGSGGHSSYWNGTTADIFARLDYLTMVNETVRAGFGWPILNTEGGTSCGAINGTRCLSSTVAILKGSAGYTDVSLQYVQDLVNHEDAASPRIGRLFWPAASWTDTPNAGLFGALNNGEWGTLLTYSKFPASPIVTISNVNPDPITTHQAVTVDFNVVIPEGSVASINVIWGDGTTSTGLAADTTSADHNYTSTGSASTRAFTINVTATDDSGLTGSATRNVTVNSSLSRGSSSLLLPMLYFVVGGLATGIAATLLFLRLRGKVRQNSQSPKRGNAGSEKLKVGFQDSRKAP